MISKVEIERVLHCALAQGGDFAELYWEDTLSNGCVMLDGVVESATTARAHGAGLRVYAGLRSVYVHTCDTTLGGLLAVARQAADAVASAGAGLDIALNGDGGRCANRHPVQIMPSSFGYSRKRALLRGASGAARAVSASIAQVRVTLTDADRHILIANSDGLFVGDEQTRVRLGVMAVASENGESQVGFEGPGALCGYEFFESQTDAEAVGREAARVAMTALKAKPCPAGEMPVVIDNGFGGVIFHEACGHSLEATSVALGNSEFCGKLGQRIASDVVTAIDDGTIRNAWGSVNIDDEGVEAGRLLLIERGILKNYMVDRLNGRRMGLPPTGSARRQSFAYQPTSRMRNTFIAPGEDDESAMIATMGDGLYAKKMGGGSVNPVTGEFNFSVSEGYLVRDGQIAEPVRGATLVGKGCEILLRIDRVGRQLRLAEGLCGSLSGSIPVCVGQPMIRVTNMTVGGQG